MNRQAQILTKLLLYYSLAYSIVFLGWIPTYLVTDFTWGICVSLGYQLFALALETYLVRCEWVRRNISEKKKLLQDNKEYDVELEIVHFATQGAAHSKSILHAIISGLGALYLSKIPSDIHRDHVFGYDVLSLVHNIHSAAYFVGDIFDMLRYVKPFEVMDWVFIVHHLIGVTAFSFPVIVRVGMYFSSMGLLFELSTPFLGLRWWLIQLHMGSSNLFKLVNYSFAVTFIYYRFVWGVFTFTLQTCNELIPLLFGSIHPERFPLYRPGKDSMVRFISFLSLGLILIANLINSYFLYNMIKMLTRKRK
jgi:hypothetical protein